MAEMVARGLHATLEPHMLMDISQLREARHVSVPRTQDEDGADDSRLLDKRSTTPQRDRAVAVLVSIVGMLAVAVAFLLLNGVRRRADSENTGNAFWEESRALGVIEPVSSNNPFKWPIVADSPRVSPWQKFRKLRREHGLICLNTIHGRFVTTQADGRITGDATSIGQWQMLRPVINPGGITGASSGSISFKTWIGMYITADAQGHLNASSPSVSLWETFQEVDNHDGTVSYKTAHGKYITAVRLKVTHTSDERMEKTFEDIYAKNEWQFGSGYGSLPQNTVGYRHYLRSFMEEHHIQSVVDVGCGDWQFSRLMNWSGINYLGVDIVESVIEQDKRKYEKHGIRFHRGSLTDELPVAELLLAREVLQHLPLDIIFQFLKNNVLSGRYRFVLLTNEMLKPGEVNIDAQVNGQVPARGLNLTAAPFNVQNLQEVYRHGETQTVLLDQRAKYRDYMRAREMTGIMG